MNKKRPISLKSRLLLDFFIVAGIMAVGFVLVFFSFNRSSRYFQNNFEYHYKIQSITVTINELNNIINNFIYGLTVADYINQYNYDYLQLLKEIDILQYNTAADSEIYYMLSDLRNYIYSFNDHVISITDKKGDISNEIEVSRELKMLAEKKTYVLEEVNRILYTSYSENYQFYSDKIRQITLVRNLSIMIIVIAVSIIMIFSLRFSRNVSAPIHELSERMDNFSREVYTAEKMNEVTDADISKIISTYNKMVYRIQELVREIEGKVELEKQLRKKDLQNMEMKDLLLQSEMEYLKSQVNPHFLFNTLNLITTLAGMEEAHDSVAVIKRLTNMMRYSLRDNAGLVSLKEELNIIRDYIYIQKVRFCGKIEAIFNINENYTDIEIPPMILQPLVENAVIHGLEPKKDGGRIIIALKKSSTKLILSVSDNGIGFDPRQLENDSVSERNHIGLRNVIRRLELKYGKNILSINSSSEWGTEVVIEFPFDDFSESRQG